MEQPKGKIDIVNKQMNAKENVIVICDSEWKMQPNEQIEGRIKDRMKKNRDTR